MNILVTGGSGFVGSALIDRLLAQGHTTYSLARSPQTLRVNVVQWQGDICQPGLGLPGESPVHFDQVYHLAAIHHLGEDRDGSIWRTNVEGTKNVIDFCRQRHIHHLFFCSTAYTQGRNPYEMSKAVCEKMAKEADIPAVTIFKPSVVMATPDNFFPGHFSQIVQLIIKTLTKARTTWRKIEETLRLPMLLEPVLRIEGNPRGNINMVTVDQVAARMSEIKEAGIFWLTNPAPPTVQEVFDWVGEELMVRITVMPSFKAMPLEAVLRRKIQAFLPYLQGDNFPSDIPKCPEITKELIKVTINKTLTGSSPIKL